MYKFPRNSLKIFSREFCKNKKYDFQKVFFEKKILKKYFSSLKNFLKIMKFFNKKFPRFWSKNDLLTFYIYDYI